jgi:hypothetical protein
VSTCRRAAAWTCPDATARAPSAGW